MSDPKIRVERFADDNLDYIENIEEEEEEHTED